MQNASYQTIFEISWRSFPWFFYFPLIVLISVGILLLLFGWRSQIRLAVGTLIIAFCLFALLITAPQQIVRYLSARSAYQRGESSVVEGTIADFHPMPLLGPAKESFSVGDNIFSYNVLDVSPCFRDAPPHEGPIHSGMYVRIYFKDACIQRVDVRR